MPPAAIASRTAAARSRESFSFNGRGPTSSVWPSIESLSVGFSFRSLTISATVFAASGFSAALAPSKPT